MSLYNSSNDIPADAVAEHYERSLEVYQELGSVETDAGVFDALLVPGTSEKGIRAWYKSTKDADLPDGADGAGRPYIARTDGDDLPTEVLEWDHPTAFSTINYQSVDEDEWTPYTYGDGREWDGGKPLPEYADIRGFALFADVDFDSDAKTRPVDGETRSLVTDALEEWIGSYADAVGSRDPVYALDSVGGTYVMLAPRATYAVFDWAHRTLERSDRDRLSKEIASRWRDYNSEIQSDVSGEIPELEGVFELDGNTNKNRLYKAPLSVHKSLPGVVTPIDTENVDFGFTPIEDVDETVIEGSREWAAEFTRSPDDVEPDTLELYAESLVETLFPDWVGDGTVAWRQVLTQWLESQQREREQNASASLDDFDAEEYDTDGVTFVDDPKAVGDAAERLDIKTVLQRFGADFTATSRSGHFDPAHANWKHSDSGESCYIDDNNTVTDVGDPGGRAGPVGVAALYQGHTRKLENPSGETYWDAVDTLRKKGFDLPVYIPPKGSSYEHDGETETRSRTPNWALAKVARMLDLAPETAIDDETDEITVPTLHNRVLAVLEENGVEHGREMEGVHMDADGRDTEAAERNIDTDEYEVGETPDTADETVSGDTDGDESSQDEPDAITWTARYGIHEREFMADRGSPYEVRLPGCDELVWAEYVKYGKRTAGYAYRQEDDEGNVSYDHVINADLELVSRLTYPDQPDREVEWELRINPTDAGEEPKTVTVAPAAFNSPRDFREEIKGKSGSMRFNAVYGHQTVDALKTIVNAQDAPRRKAYSRIKLIHEGVDQPRLVTPTGTLGPGGWDGEPEHVWGDMAEGDVFDKWELEPELEEYDTESAREVAELLPQTRVHERFLPVLGYVFASTFRAPITETSVTATDKWNHIQGFGDTGAGKSSAGEKIWEFIGMEGELIKAKKTPHSSLETLSSTNAVPLLLDEYKPAEWRSHKRDAFHEYMRDSSTGSSTTKTYNYPMQKTYHLETSVVLFGEGRFPSDANALARRTIETTLSQRATTPDTSMYDAFKELSTTLADGGEKATLHHALAWWGYALEAVGEKLSLIEEWTAAREWALEEIEGRGYDLTEALDRDMYRQMVQTITFGVRMWRSFAKDVLDADADKLPSDAEIGDALEYVVNRKNDESAINRSDRDQLFELAASAASKLGEDGNQQYLIEGEHYKFVHEETDRPTEFRLHLRSTVEELNRYVRDYSLNTDVADKNDYYSWIKEATDDPESYALDIGVVTNGKRMVSVDWDQLRDDVEVMKSDFRPWEDPGVVNEFDEDELSESDGDDPDGPDGGGSQPNRPDPVPIGSIDPSTQDVASVIGTVEFGKWDGRSTKEGAPAWTVTLSDMTGEASLVVWNEDDIPDMYDDTGVFEPDALHVKGAATGEYDGTLQLEVTPSTAVEHAEVGAGKTSVESPADDQGQLETETTATDGGSKNTESNETDENGARDDSDSDTSDESRDETDADDGTDTAADSPGAVLPPSDAAGLKANAQRLKAILEENGDTLSKAELFGRAGDRFDISPGNADSALQKGLREGMFDDEGGEIESL